MIYRTTEHLVDENITLFRFVKVTGIVFWSNVKRIPRKGKKSLVRNSKSQTNKRMWVFEEKKTGFSKKNWDILVE